jgi:hypothetical protein
MSRGYGKVQTAVLAVLRRDAGLDTLIIAARTYRVRQPSKAQAVAVRRALAGLTRQGLVERLGTGGHGHDVRWRMTPSTKSKQTKQRKERTKATMTIN